MPLSHGLNVGLIEWTERLAQGSKDPQLSENSCPSHRSTTQGRSQAYKCNVGTTEGRGEPEGGRPASPRPAGLACVCAFVLSNCYRPQEEIIDVRERPAGLGEASRPHSAASLILASRGRQAHRPYLLTTDATCFKYPELTLEAYK